MVHWLNSVFPMQGAQVQSLVGKRRSHVLCGVAKGEKKRYEKYGTGTRMQILIDGIEMRAQK